MSTLILGKGFIGTHLANYFASHDISYIHVSRVDVDYNSQSTLNTFIRSSNINTVINCSGYTGVPNVDACETNKKLCYDYNVTYPLNVAATCNELGVPLYHIGSGCIYTGYDKEFTEKDEPNFGIHSDDSSFYSKCKHIFETAIRDENTRILRIRIPFTSNVSSKNYIMKLLKYDTLISKKNSITSVTDFCLFLTQLIKLNPDHGIYNVVNPDPVTAKDVTAILQRHNIFNKNWKYIDVKDLETKAQRSNCILSTSKIKNLGLELPSAYDSLSRDIELFANSHVSA